MRNISNGITLKHWFKVVEKIEQFDLGGLRQINSKDQALAHAVNEIRKSFQEYNIEMAFFYSR
jgi:hypothetical protein